MRQSAPTDISISKKLPEWYSESQYRKDDQHPDPPSTVCGGAPLRMLGSPRMKTSLRAWQV